MLANRSQPLLVYTTGGINNMKEIMRIVDWFSDRDGRLQREWLKKIEFVFFIDKFVSILNSHKQYSWGDKWDLYIHRRGLIY